ncbi:GNAT superfamily N-acetyltransferase [Rhizobium sp. BK316]|uniref:GNAT family N-acetyltransferase n=1 Tax=Rhizobium sp. BK316 TaxID=2587053 RepID=UPI001621B277|nr:GNAT family N-acetyltransferase [Rhizobium sp. BK316]MBB3411199.1 GNAT superfamily N-acetyltransferase [Rhizobium sp. BK316]
MSETVRYAVPQDEDKIISMISLLHDENGLFPLSEKRVREYMQRYFRKEGALIGVIGDIGDPVASIYLGIEQPYYSDAWYLNEAWNFVHPDHRRSDYAKKLLGWAKDISEQMKLPLMVGIVSNHRTEAKVRLYEKQLEKAGAFFVWNRHLVGPSAWDK